MATLALGSIDYRTEHCEPREEAQCRTDRADCIAVSPAVPPCKNHNHYQGDQGDYECRQALEPDFLGVEGVTFTTLSNCGKQVVTPLPDWCQEILDDPSP